MKTFEQGPIWGGRTFFAPEADTDLVKAYTQFKSGEYDPYAAGWVTIQYNSTSGNFTPTATVWYTKPDQQPGALKNITEITPVVRNGMQEAYAGEFTKNASLVVKSATRR